MIRDKSTVATGLALALTMSFTQALAKGHLKEIDPSKIINETDPLIVAAFNILVRRESNNQHFGGPESVAGKNEPTTSNKNALGVAQVLLSSAQSELEKSGYIFDKAKIMYDPPTNHSTGLIIYRDGGFKRRIFTQYCSELNQEAFKLAAGIYHSGGKNVYLAVKKYGENWDVAQGSNALGPKGRAYIRNTKADFDKLLTENYPERLKMLLDAAPCHFETHKNATRPPKTLKTPTQRK